MAKNFPRSITRLIEVLTRLPSIGEKSATRLVFHLIRSPDGLTRELGEAALFLKKDLQLCPTCRNVTDAEVCPVCADVARDHTQICVVAEPLDALTFERAGFFRGVYHVLHGLLDPLAGIGPSELTFVELITRVEKTAPSELILALNPSTEGEATAAYLTRELARFPMKVTRIARGLPTGSELSYADEITLAAALNGRREA